MAVPRSDQEHPRWHRLTDPKRSYGLAVIVLAVIGLIGLGATIMLPSSEPAPGADAPVPSAEQAS